MPIEDKLEVEAVRGRTPAFWRISFALAAAAFCMFAIVYSVQPLLPLLAEVFHVSPTISSLALSIPTAVLSVGILLTGTVSEVLGRKPIMRWSLLAASVLTLGTAVAPTWNIFLATRALVGVALSGVPAIAMAYVSEEIHPSAGGLAMGLYVGATGIGGMVGRLAAAILTDALSFRWAVGIIGMVCVALSLLFWILLPPSRRFVAHEASVSGLARTMLNHIGDRGLLSLYVVSFLLMGSFISTFNYIAFRLRIPPYNLSQTEVGLLFLVYFGGIGCAAWIGELAGRHGSREFLWMMLVVTLLGVLTTLARPLWVILVGLTLVGCGFFAGHTVASAWTGRRALRAKAQATSLYLFFYYMGASFLGTFTGKAWSLGGWNGVVEMLSAALIVGLGVALSLRHLPRIAPPNF